MLRCFFCALPGFLNHARFLGQNPGIMGAGQKQKREVVTMIIKFLEDLLHWNEAISDKWCKHFCIALFIYM